eukprot:scaffold8085_cov127-Isochrysis_galbana.AAC.8
MGSADDELVPEGGEDALFVGQNKPFGSLTVRRQPREAGQVSQLDPLLFHLRKKDANVTRGGRRAGAGGGRQSKGGEAVRELHTGFCCWAVGGDGGGKASHHSTSRAMQARARGGAAARGPRRARLQKFKLSDQHSDWRSDAASPVRKHTLAARYTAASRSSRGSSSTIERRRKKRRI